MADEENDGDTRSLQPARGAERVLSTGANGCIFTAGRPPWYSTDGVRSQAFVIGITGGSASGKTSVAEQIIAALDVPWVCLLSMDSFYKVLGPAELELAHANNFNFDHPDAFDIDLLVETLKKLKQGQQVEIPVYDFSTHSRTTEPVTMYGASVIIFEGILAFSTPALRELMDVKLFVSEDDDIRLARRLRRDIAERGRDLKGALKQYFKFVKPAFDSFIQPTMEFADMVVPRGISNPVAMDLIIRHVKSQLQLTGHTFRKDLPEVHADERAMPSTLHVLKQTQQVCGLHTIIRNRETTRDDFVFYSDRLMRLLMEFALSFLPYKRTQTETSCGAACSGHEMDASVVGVSILRAGLTLEAALRATVKDAAFGHILIQSNPKTKEPELHYLKLPHIAANGFVILMDATIATGAAAMMAIRVLLDHDVPEDHILLCSLIAAPTGVHSVAYAFPKVRIIISALDDSLNENLHILPGAGNFGDRYFLL